MTNRTRRSALGAAMLALATPLGADIGALYETGPAQDSSFVRFLNATGGPIAVVAAKGGYRLPLAGDTRVSKFHPALAGAKLKAGVEVGSKVLPIEVTAKPGEYVTVVVMAAGKDAWRTQLIREAPSDYSASRASIALANADPECKAATLTGGAANVAIFEGVSAFSTKRRLVNPVKLSATLACDGKALEKPIDFGQLEPGERYSAFVIRSGTAREAFVVRDASL